MTVVLLISGSTRAASTNSAALRTVSAIAPDGVETRWYDGLAELPAFNPDDDGTTHPSVVGLREQLSRADAVLLAAAEFRSGASAVLCGLVRHAERARR
ncbi:NADPH-dependent FMN reductase [Nocardia gipuzkoensis]